MLAGISERAAAMRRPAGERQRVIELPFVGRAPLAHTFGRFAHHHSDEALLDAFLFICVR